MGSFFYFINCLISFILYIEHLTRFFRQILIFFLISSEFLHKNDVFKRIRYQGSSEVWIVLILKIIIFVGIMHWYWDIVIKLILRMIAYIFVLFNWNPAQQKMFFFFNYILEIINLFYRQFWSCFIISKIILHHSLLT